MVQENTFSSQDKDEPRETGGLPSGAPEGRRLWRWLAAGIAVIGIAVGGYATWWHAAATRGEQEIRAWFAVKRAQGVDARFERLEISGFPSRLDARIENPSFVDAAGGTWSWHAERVDLSARPWDFTTVRFRILGRQEAMITTRRKRRTIVVEDELLGGEIRFQGGRAVSATTKAKALRIDLPETAGDPFTASEAEVDLSTSETNEPILRLMLRDLRLPAELRAPLGTEVRRASVNARLTGPLDLSAWPGALIHWRDGGGTLEIESLDLDYPPLGMSGSGTVALDEAEQPIAAFSVRVRGFLKTIDRLHDLKIMSKGGAIGAKLVLGALAKRPEGGGTPYVETPLAVQDRILSVGPVEILRFRPIVW